MKDIVQIGVYMPRELKYNLKAELDREGQNITEFVIKQARKYLKKKRIWLPKSRSEEKAG